MWCRVAYLISIRLCLRNRPSLNRRRIQAFDLICRHDVNLGLAFAKFDCTSDGDDFPLDLRRDVSACRLTPKKFTSGILVRNREAWATVKNGNIFSNQLVNIDFVDTLSTNAVGWVEAIAETHHPCAIR
jgi:hypothetical protein